MARFFCISLAIAMIIVVSFSLSFAQEEQITITTYYPSPHGSYHELEWGELPNSRGLLKADQGSSIELGGRGEPYISFFNDMNPANAYDVRIRLRDDDSLIVDGGLIYNAVGCVRRSYTVNSGDTPCPAGFSITTSSVLANWWGGVFLCCRYE